MLTPAVAIINSVTGIQWDRVVKFKIDGIYLGASEIESPVFSLKFSLATDQITESIIDTAVLDCVISDALSRNLLVDVNSFVHGVRIGG